MGERDLTEHPLTSKSVYRGRMLDVREDEVRLPDGTLRYRVRSSAQWEIIPWVQSFGALAELVAPAGWRDGLRGNLEAALRRYGP